MLVVAVAVLSCSLSLFLIEKSMIINVVDYPMQVKVIEPGKSIGLNADPNLFFGAIEQGGTSWKKLELSNAQEDLVVSISKKGNIAEWVSGPKKLVVRQGKDINITIAMKVPKDAAIGKHYGELTVIIRKVSII